MIQILYQDVWIVILYQVTLHRAWVSADLLEVILEHGALGLRQVGDEVVLGRDAYFVAVQVHQPHVVWDSVRHQEAMMSRQHEGCKKERGTLMVVKY